MSDRRREYDMRLTLKRNGLYPDECGVNFDVERGKVWICIEDEPRQAICIETPRLRRMLELDDAELAASGLPPMTEHGYGR